MPPGFSKIVKYDENGLGRDYYTFHYLQPYLTYDMARRYLKKHLARKFKEKLDAGITGWDLLTDNSYSGSGGYSDRTPGLSEIDWENSGKHSVFIVVGYPAYGPDGEWAVDKNGYSLFHGKYKFKGSKLLQILEELRFKIEQKSLF